MTYHSTCVTCEVIQGHLLGFIVWIILIAGTGCNLYAWPNVKVSTHPTLKTWSLVRCRFISKVTPKAVSVWTQIFSNLKQIKITRFSWHYSFAEVTISFFTETAYRTLYSFVFHSVYVLRSLTEHLLCLQKHVASNDEYYHKQVAREIYFQLQRETLYKVKITVICLYIYSDARNWDTKVHAIHPRPRKQRLRNVKSPEWRCKYSFEDEIVSGYCKEVFIMSSRHLTDASWASTL